MHDTQSTPISPTLDGQVRGWLRLEGLAMFIAGAAIYGHLNGHWLWFVPALLAVDISAAGYLRGPRAGALLYNLFHVWATGLVVLGLGLVLAIPVLALAAGVLIAHTGMDRAVGYGLKLSTGFGDTHLGHIGKRKASPATTATASAIVA